MAKKYFSMSHILIKNCAESSKIPLQNMDLFFNPIYKLRGIFPSIKKSDRYQISTFIFNRQLCKRICTLMNEITAKSKIIHSYFRVEPKKYDQYRRIYWPLFINFTRSNYFFIRVFFIHPLYK
jgi:hypothetical protein